MNENDTILLLRECDSGLKMAISSLDEVLDVIKNKHFKNQCIESKNKHQTLKKEIDQLLKENNIKEKEPSLMAKSMSWLKMNFKIQMNEDNQTIASLLFEGCSMGIESLFKYLHQYDHADTKIKKLTYDLIEIEKELSDKIQNYL